MLSNPKTSMTAPRPRPGLLVQIALLLVVLAVEFFLFDTHESRAQAKVYPRWNDQIQYLTESYTGYEYARAHGLAAGLWHTLIKPSAQGTLHDFAAVIAFTLAGPSRNAALALNMLALIAWQAALFFAIARRTQSLALAWAAAALPLCLSGPWQNAPGSAIDFRLDHLAMCALGVTSAAALMVDRFRSRRWSLAFGTAVGITLLTRFLTGAYFVLIFAALLTWILRGDEKKLRTINLALAAAVAAAMAAPIFWLNREWVWNYYYIGHYFGPESAIRDPHFDLGQSVAFVWENFGQRQLGSFFGWLAALGTAALVIGAFFATSTPKQTPASAASRRGWWTLGAVFLLVPALILTLHQQKSEVVLGALAPGAIVLIIAAWAALLCRCTLRWLPPVFAAAVVIAAGWKFTARQLGPTGDEAAHDHFQEVAALADYVFARAQAAGLKEPRVATDYIGDCLDGQVLRVVCYERHHAWVPFVMTLPISIAEPSETQVMERLEQSDFVFLTEEASAGGYPFDQKLAAMRPQLRAWCDSHLRLIEHFSLIGRRMVLYQRREIPLP